LRMMKTPHLRDFQPAVVVSGPHLRPIQGCGQYSSMFRAR
jgi:hypothetical protein